MIEVEMIY